MFERLLICTELSDGLERLTQFVPDLAKGGIRKITFLHVVPLQEEGAIPRVDTARIEQAQKQLAIAQSHNLAGVTVKVEVQSGRPVETILQTVKTLQPDVVILGTENRTLLNEKLFGSTLADLCRRTPVPLLVLRPQLISTYTTEELSLRCQHLFRWLMIPYDGHEASTYLLQQVKTAVQRQSTPSLYQCLLCYVRQDKKTQQLSKEQLLQQAQTTLAAAKADLEQLNLQVHTEVRQGDAIAQVLEVAKTGEVSAIAIASGTLGRFSEWSVSSFAGELLRRSWHPILFFPNRPEASH